MNIIWFGKHKSKRVRMQFNYDHNIERGKGSAVQRTVSFLEADISVEEKLFFR